MRFESNKNYFAFGCTNVIFADCKKCPGPSPGPSKTDFYPDEKGEVLKAFLSKITQVQREVNLNIIYHQKKENL